VAYDKLTPKKIVVTDLDGNIVDGTLRPSSDLDTHLELYRHFQQIGAVAHTHSECATAWAQAKREIPCFGTTHADSFHGPIPVTAELSEQQIAGDYERETGVAIVQRFYTLDPETSPAALVAGHGPFCWGANAAEAAHNAAILEFVARMACQTLALNPQAKPLQTPLHDKHFLRKHGSAATYGQADAPSDSTVLE
jgi:L-ribulose-5-phosphate 4-epimerase